MKTCRTCGEAKSLLEFHKQPKAKDGRFNICKKCSHKKIAEDRKDPEQRAKWDLYAWRSLLRHRYGINEEQYLAILADQDGGCAICGALTAAESFQRRLHVDHCHKTGIVRGLLCGKCNSGIGLFNDDPRSLRAAADYLERYLVKEAAE